MRIKLGRPLLIRQISEYLGCRMRNGGENGCLFAVSHLTTDSREVLPGDLFIALKTEKDDGHRYLGEAIRNGASAIIAAYEASHEVPPDLCLFLVSDTWDALAQFAARFSGDIPHKTIAVTGSVGKTTTRHLLASVLGEKFKIHESSGNYNNLLGTCLTLLSMPGDTELLIAECGMDAPGQISRMSRVLKPNDSVITGIGISHLEKLKTVEAICRAKLEILDGMREGSLFCPAAEPLLLRLSPVPVHTYSAMDTGAEYHAENVRETPDGFSFDLRVPDRTLTCLSTPLISQRLLAGAVLAASIGYLLGETEDELRRGLRRYRPLPLRQNIQPLGEFFLLLDCYNACPDSMKAAGEAAIHLAKMTGGKIVLLLGDMSELGENSDYLHREVGAYFGSIARDLFCVGQNAHLYASGVTGECRVHTYLPDTDPGQVVNDLFPVIRRNDVLLIKGSRSAAMETYIPLLKEKLGY